MDQIRAFVGHSFSEADKPVVGAFLEFFDQLKGLLPHFSWEHAFAAEPKELAEKVMALIADKNTFTGICTKNEVAASENAFKPPLFRPSVRNISIASLKPKASDWVIQEIGLAKGRGMEIVLLVEEGLREPGGLQGNIEYISFTRDNPQKAFGRIVEMVRALSPKQRTSPSASEPTSSDNNSDVTTAGESDPTPSPEWKLEDYRRAAFKAILREQEDVFASVSGAFLGSVHNTGGEAIAVWSSDAETWKIIFGKRGNLDTIKKLSSQHPNNHELLANLARCLAHYDDHAESAEAYLKAAICADADTNVFLRARAAGEFAAARQFARAEVLLDELCTVDRNAFVVLNTIQELGELRKDEDSQIAALERKVELSPDDFETRFSLAYKHSEIGNEDIALHHYLQVPRDSRSERGWNNLGVQFDHFKMPNRAVNAYRTAEGKGNTLAMSNLAFKFMEAGFLDESKEMFDRARQVEDYHKNVDTGLAQLKSVPDNEQKILTETLEKSRQKVDFYRELGDAIAKSKCIALNGQWQGKEAVLASTITADTFKAVGTYEIKGNALAGLLFGSPSQTTTYEIEYECKLVGRTFVGTVRRKQQGEKATNLLNGDGKTKVLMYLSDDCRTIEIMENPHSTHSSFHQLRAV